GVPSARPRPGPAPANRKAGVEDRRRSRMSRDARLAGKCRAGILDVDGMGRERIDARPAGETPSAFLVEGARSMIFGERPEVRLLDIQFAKPMQGVVVKHASDASAPEPWQHV